MPLAVVAGDGATYLGVDPNLVAGVEALERGRYRDGVEYTRAGLGAAVSQDHRAAALSNLCAGYAGLRQYDLAIVHCSEALGIEPENWHALNNRAIAYLGKGQLRLARRDVLAGLELHPDSDTLKRVAALVEAAARAPHALDDDRDPLT